MVQPSDAPLESTEATVELQPQQDQDQSQSTTDDVKKAPPPEKAPPSKQAKPSTRGYAHLFKFVVVGNSGVGKTALVKRYTKDEFIPSRDYTIGVDFDIKTVPLSNGDEVKLQIWDTAGQERYRTITTSYYRGAHGIIIVYDINYKESFDSVRQWMHEVDRYCNDDVVIAIAGNMTDLGSSESVTFGKDQLKELSEVSDSDRAVVGVYECSCKTGEGVEQIFQSAVDELVTRRLDERNPLRKGKTLFGAQSIKLEANSQKAKKKGCC